MRRWQRLSIEGIRNEISWVWDSTAYKAFLPMLTGLGNSEASFFSGIKAVFMENRGCNDLQHATEGAHDAAAYLYTILLYRDNGGTAADDTAKLYMRWVASGGTTMSRWLSNEGCLPLREKATRAIHSSTWRIWGGMNHCRLRHRCAAIRHAQATTTDKGWLQISLFCSKNCSCAAKW
jgi:hypothetical protein